jgi:hypothetical protein
MQSMLSAARGKRKKLNRRLDGVFPREQKQTQRTKAGMTDSLQFESGIHELRRPWLGQYGVKSWQYADGRRIVVVDALS